MLPDYQGIGIGTKFIKQVAQMVSARGFELNLTTTTPSLIYALKKSDNWKLARYGRAKGNYDRMVKAYGMKERHLSNASSSSRITFSFWFHNATKK